ncbi:MAG: dihydroneopterin aldolase [Rhodanobacter sp.]|nr:MAG: dihydroneopterin aldolase [Rhodanobacter sp.]TAM12726.1 MAG: dihydroneopterin aldolase [Rhodanobacter sp.]TAM36622.1 MAG: dihydroneopterin aldolase [Rhodanobacter sp.]
MDTVFIEHLEVQAEIGVYAWERGTRRTLWFDIEMAFDNTVPAATDEVAHTVDYATVAERITAYAGETHFRLLETLAERCAVLLRQEFHVPWLRLKLSKPGAVVTARAVGVCIERGERPR